jgi:hypothetical protein
LVVFELAAPVPTPQYSFSFSIPHHNAPSFWRQFAAFVAVLAKRSFEFWHDHDDGGGGDDDVPAVVGADEGSGPQHALQSCGQNFCRATDEFVNAARSEGSEMPGFKAVLPMLETTMSSRASKVHNAMLKADLSPDPAFLAEAAILMTACSACARSGARYWKWTVHSSESPFLTEAGNGSGADMSGVSGQSCSAAAPPEHARTLWRRAKSGDISATL